MSQRPLLGLVIMIKNGATVIEKTLRSIHPYIDHWDILDTGSTDGTQKIILDVLNSPVTKVSYDFNTETYSEAPNTIIPGTLWEEPFINFRDSRNRLLDLAGTTCTFTIMLDDSYIVHGGDKLLKILAIARSRSIHSLALKITTDSVCYPSERILRTEHRVRYKRRIHEIPDSPVPPVTVQDEAIYIYDFEEPTTAVRSKNRYQKDAEWLLQDCLDDPEDSRTWFYLSRTLGLLDRYHESNACLLKRISLMDKVSKDEEAFVSMLDLAVCHDIGLKTPWATIEQMYLDAYTYMPHRAEPLFAIGLHYYELAHRDDHDETYASRLGFGMESLKLDEVDGTAASTASTASTDNGNVALLNDIRKYLVKPEDVKIIADSRASRMGNMHKAFVFVKAASEIAFPENDRLFVERSMYEFFVPEKLAIIAVNLGKYKIAKKAALKAIGYRPFKDSARPPPDVTNLKLIVTHCNRYLGTFDDDDISQMSTIMARSAAPPRTDDSVIDNSPQCAGGTMRNVLINCGVNSYHTEWGPQTAGLGGSETMVVGMAEQFARLYPANVYVFSNVVNGVTHNGVTYIHHDYYDLAIKCLQLHDQKIDVLLVSRYADNLRYFDAEATGETFVKKQFLWIHDTGIIARGETKIELLKVDAFLTLSQWHKSIIEPYGIPPQKIVVTRNAIDPTPWKSKKQPAKVPYRFIYSSCLTRGIETILDMWPAIRRKFPTATLRIFAEFTPHIVRTWGPEKVEAFEHRIAYMKTMGVTMLPRATKQELAAEYLAASVWFYPTTFEETYCITALEAMAAGCICICSDLAALKETCGNGRAHLIADPEKFTVDDLVHTLKTNDPKMQEKAKEWALSQTYESLFYEWKDMLNF